MGITNIIDKDKFMEEQIESLTELEKVKLVNRILNKMGSNQLFKPEGKESIHPVVLQETYKLLNEWMKQDNNILRTEYDEFVMDNENNGETKTRVINDTTKMGWEKGESFKGPRVNSKDKWKVNDKKTTEDWMTVNHRKQKKSN